MEPIVVDDLWKSYSGRGKEILALREINFNVSEGEILGILGPNGAGKTTLSLIISGLLKPSRGTVFIMGEDIRRLKRRVCEKYITLYLTGYMNLEQGFIRLPAIKYLEMLAAINCIRGNIREKATEVLRAVGLLAWKDEWPARFSSGMQRKLMLAEILMNDKPCIVLDEPTIHLDPLSCMEIWAVLKKLKDDGKTILLTTQNMEEAEYLCDRIIFLNREVIASGSPKDLKGLVQKYDRIMIKVRGRYSEFRSEIEKIEGVTEVDEIKDDSTIVVKAIKGSLKPKSLVELSSSSGTEILSLTYEEPTLSDVFRMLVGSEASEHKSGA